MKNHSSHTGIIIVVIVVVIAAIGYFYVQGSSTNVNSGLSAQDTTDVGLAEVNLLNQIKNIKIDTSLFQDPTYLSLRDYTVSITPENVGRPNPFAPVPGVGTPLSNTTTGK